MSTEGNAGKTAVVTGASIGLGLETARQLGDAGYGTVVVTARSDAKAASALASLATAVPTATFQSVVLDLDDAGSTEAAAGDLIARFNPIDVLILNAGIAPGSELRHTDDGIEMVMAASLTGHHRLTMRLIKAGALAANA